MMAPPRRNVFDALELIVDGPLDIAQDLADSLVHHGLLHRHGIHCFEVGGATGAEQMAVARNAG